MNRNLLSASLLVILTATAACSTRDECGSFAAVDAGGWNYGDSLQFVLNMPEDSVIEGNLAIVVRHSASYDYSNLWLEISYPTVEGLSPDTFNIRLSDSYGNWYGKGLGLSFQQTDTVGRRLKLASPATLSARHIMRVDCLEDIEQIGLYIIPD